MKSLVLHDFFAFPGGGELVALSMAEALGASVVTGFVNKEDLSPGYFQNIEVADLDAIKRYRLWSCFSRTVALVRAYQSMPFARTDLALFSGALCPIAAKNVAGKRIWYCHTPPRPLYDMKDYYLLKHNGLSKILYKTIMAYYEKTFLEAMPLMDMILVNSNTIRLRLKKYMGYDARILYPPCDTEKFRWMGQSDYYLSTARVDDLKRVSVIVDAFLRMPEKKLIVVSGGSCLHEVKNKAKKADNISVLGWVSFEKLRTLVGNCVATIYIPRNEDFGISPVESMAAGKPVIGVREGGVQETVMDGETGILLPENPGEQDVRLAVAEMDKEKASSMRYSCEVRAKRFSKSRFVKGLLGFVGSVA